MSKKRPKSRPSGGVSAEERKRQRLDARRQARAEAAAAARRRAIRERVVRWLLYGALAFVLVWFFFLRTATPDEIAGHPVEKFSERGVNEHTSTQVGYPMTPPVAGPHAQAPAPCGIHARPVPNENLVHSLEHGAVGVLYRPDQVDLETIRAIEELVDSYPSRTISMPFVGMDPAIAVISWGEMMKLDSFDREAVREYIEAFRGKGPEDVECPNEASQQFEPAPSPSPVASPTDQPSPQATEDEGASG